MNRQAQQQGQCKVLILLPSPAPENAEKETGRLLLGAPPVWIEYVVEVVLDVVGGSVEVPRDTGSDQAGVPGEPAKPTGGEQSQTCAPERWELTFRKKRAGGGLPAEELLSYGMGGLLGLLLLIIICNEASKTGRTY